MKKKTSLSNSKLFFIRVDERSSDSYIDRDGFFDCFFFSGIKNLSQIYFFEFTQISRLKFTFSNFRFACEIKFFTWKWVYFMKKYLCSRNSRGLTRKRFFIIYSLSLTLFQLSVGYVLQTWFIK